MADNQEHQTKKIIVKIRNANRVEELTVDEDITIEALSEIVRPIFNVFEEPLRFIFAGKVIKEHETLKSHNVRDGFVVHLVIKRRVANESSNTESNASRSEQQPSIPNLLSGNVRDLFNIPIFDNLFANPENVRSVIMSNPQVQELIDRQPEIAHLFNNPEIFRQAIEIIRNPSMMQEMIRSQDRALSNLESIPGGYNALERMYRDIQEPMINAAVNPFGVFQNEQLRTPPSSANHQQGRENRDPLPNPWTANNVNNIFSPSLLENLGTPPVNQLNDDYQRMVNDVMQLMMQGGVGTTPSAMPGTTTVTTIPTTVTSAASTTTSGPTSVMSESSFLVEDERDNIQVAEAGAVNAKAAASQAESSEIAEIAAAAAARASLAAADAGMAAARAGLAAVNNGSFADAALAARHAAEASEAAARAGRAAAAAAVTASENAVTIRNQEAIALDSANEESTQVIVSNEDKYQAELTKLCEMGFVDRESNLKALIESNGNVSVAIERLLSLDPLNFE